MPFPKYGVFMAFIVGFPVLAVAAAKQKVISGLAVLFESQPQTATDSGGGQIAGDASSSTALANMRHATLVFEKNPEYAVKINTREGEQGLLLRVMKGIDSLILKTSRQPNWNLLPEAPPLLCSTLPGGRLNMTYDAWFNKIFKVRNPFPVPVGGKKLGTCFLDRCSKQLDFSRFWTLTPHACSETPRGI